MQVLGARDRHRRQVRRLGGRGELEKVGAVAEDAGAGARGGGAAARPGVAARTTLVGGVAEKTWPN